MAFWYLLQSSTLSGTPIVVGIAIWLRLPSLSFTKMPPPPVLHRETTTNWKSSPSQTECTFLSSLRPQGKAERDTLMRLHKDQSRELQNRRERAVLAMNCAHTMKAVGNQFHKVSNSVRDTTAKMQALGKSLSCAAATG